MTTDQWLSAVLTAVAFIAFLAGWVVLSAAPGAGWVAAVAIGCYVLAAGASVAEVVFRFRSRGKGERK